MHGAQHTGKLQAGNKKEALTLLVAQEPRLVQHGITSDPIICVCGRLLSCMDHASLDTLSPGGILLPPSSWHWLQFWSDSQHSFLAQVTTAVVLAPSVRAGDPSRPGSLSRGQECLPVSPVSSDHILFLDLSGDGSP